MDFDNGMSVSLLYEYFFLVIVTISFLVNNVFAEDLDRYYTNCLLLGFAFFFFITVIVIIYLRCICSNNNKIIKGKATDSLHLLESQPIEFPHVSKSAVRSIHNIDNLVLLESVGKGSYGTVWKGKLNDTIVAVKVFEDADKRFIVNECRIYSLPFMNHSSLPQFYGYKEMLNESGYRQHCIAIEYGPLGSLQNYLNEHTLDWSQLCKFINSIVQAVAYLHTEVFKENKHKPSIAHRDLCSSNIVVKADMTCLICDYQFAVQFVDNRNPLIEDRSMVGTARYMAPELLEGAINFRQCESSLKQADIYALGLILWEISSRCIDLYQGIDVPLYKLPFEQEVGPTPTFDQLKVLVNRHKARPLFPDIWKDSNPAIRLLKETIVECWDHEPEARLTALCIEERSLELPLLWTRYKMETLSNCCVVTSLQQQFKSLQNNTSSNNNCSLNNAYCSNKTELCSHETSVLNDALEAKYSQSNCYINKFENSLHYKYNNHHHLLHHPHHKHHFYQMALNNSKKQDLNSTMEKNLHAAAVISNQPKLTLPLQPHQARNPCIERNLMLNTTDEYDGLLEQGLKFQTKNYIKSNTGTDSLQENADHDMNHGDYSENRALIRLSLPMPISYVQNPVGIDSETPVVKEKDTNKYQNCNQPTLEAVKLNFFEMIKLKLAHLSYINKSKHKASTEDCEKARIPNSGAPPGTNFFAKNGPEYLKSSNMNSSICNLNSNPNNLNSLALNSSSLISPECDLSYSNTKDLSFQSCDTKGLLANTTGSATQRHLISQLEKLNNQIENLDVYMSANKIEPVNENDDNCVDESLLLQTQ